MAYRSQILSSSYGGTTSPVIGGPDIINAWDDFLYDGLTANFELPWGNQSRNGKIFQVATATHPGVWSLQTVNANNDSQGISMGVTDVGNGAGSIILGSGIIQYYWIVQLPTLATVGEDYRCVIGLAQSFSGFGAGAGGTDGVYFRYDRAVNVNWLCVTKIASVATSTDSTIAVGTGYVLLGCTINAAATSVVFTINGTTVATNATNIPTASIGWGAQIMKIAGTAVRLLNVDYWGYTQKMTTSRF